MKANLFLLFVLFAFFFAPLSSNAQWLGQAQGIVPNNSGIFGLSVVDAQVVWAVAFNANSFSSVPLTHLGKVLRTRDGGLTWKAYDIEEAIGRLSWDIHAVDSLTAFITTQDLNNGKGRGIFKTTDGGLTWTEKIHHVAGGVWLRFFDAQNGIAINREAVLTTVDGGETWQTASNIPGFKSGEFTLITSGLNSCAVKDNYLWFGTSGGRICRTRDRGKTWAFFDSGEGTAATIYSVAFRDTLNGMATSFLNGAYSLLTTQDGGKTWQKLPANGNAARITNLAYVPGTDATFIGGSANDQIINIRVSSYTTDFGKTWKKINNGINFGAFDFHSPNAGWCTTAIVGAATQPAVYKWNGAGLVGAEDLNESLSGIGLYPNPFVDQLRLQNLPEGVDWQIDLLDQLGRTVKSGTSGKNTETVFSVGEMPAGLYFLRLSGEGRVLTGRVVRQ